MSWFSEVQQRLRAGAATLTRPEQAATPPRQESTTPWAPGQSGSPSWQSRLGPNPAAPPWTPPTPPTLRPTPTRDNRRPQGQRATVAGQEFTLRPAPAGVPGAEHGRLLTSRDYGLAEQRRQVREGEVPLPRSLTTGRVTAPGARELQQRAPKAAAREAARAKSAQEREAAFDEQDRQFAQLRHNLRRAYTRELSPEEYAALAPQQQAAVQFNTRLLEVTGEGPEATRDFAASLGITSMSDEQLDSFLQLDRLIGENILKQLTPEAAEQRAANVRPDIPTPEEAEARATVLGAEAISRRMADSLAAQLGVSGRLDGTDALLGYGTTVNDRIIQQAYSTMVDSAYELTSSEVADGIATLNAKLGGTVTPQQVWDFLEAQLQTAEFNRASGGEGRLPVPEINPETGQPISPIDTAEIRRRYF